MWHFFHKLPLEAGKWCVECRFPMTQFMHKVSSIFPLLRRSAKPQRKRFASLRLAQDGVRGSVQALSIARRMHKRSRLLASEMLPDKIEHIFAHLAENGVYNDDDKSLGVWHLGPDDTLKIVRAVVDAKDGIAYVPIVDGTQDHGARPSAVATDMDYRGHPIQTEPLEAVMNLRSSVGYDAG